MTTEVVAPEPDYSDIDEADLTALRTTAAAITNSAAAAAAMLHDLVTTIRENR
jgi:hypothetical protein